VKVITNSGTRDGEKSYAVRKKFFGVWWAWDERRTTGRYRA